ncbi:MAG: hypothetical protein GEU80_08925 [Dehalococcoidia bacterium]|nr:hypothetical protein [Dehalococcoidia bacterium]
MAKAMTEDGALTMMLRREETRLVARSAEIERELAISARRLEHIRALLGTGQRPDPAQVERVTTSGTLRSVA